MQKQILTSPQHLSMWLQIVESSPVFEFQSRVQLMRKYWTARMQEMTKGGASAPEVTATLDAVVEYMQAHACLNAPVSVVPNAVSIDRRPITNRLVVLF